MTSRRNLLTSSALLATGVWVSPSIVALDRIAAATPSDPSCEIPTVSNGAAWLATPPATLAAGGPLDSNTNTWVFPETSAPFTLTAGLVVDRTTAGSFNGGSNQNVTIPAGTTICSYFVHGDRLDNRGTLTGQLNFANSSIIGLIYRRTTFPGSSFLEVPGTTYPYGPMETNDAMGLDLTPGANALKWEMRFGGGVDQIRVITSCE